MLPLDAFSQEAESTLKKFGVNTNEVIIAVTLDLDDAGDFGETWLCLDKNYLYCLSASSKDFVPKKGANNKNKKKKISAGNAGNSDDGDYESKFSNAKFVSYALNEIRTSYIDSFTSTNRLFLVMGEESRKEREEREKREKEAREQEDNKKNDTKAQQKKHEESTAPKEEEDIEEILPKRTTVGVAFSTNSKKQKLFAFLEIARRIKDGKEIKEDDSIFDQFNVSCPKCGRRYRNQHNKICMHCVDKGMLFARLLKYFDKHMHRLIFVFVTLLLSAGIGLLNPMIHGWLFVDVVISNSDEHAGMFEFFRGNILAFVFLILALNLIGMAIGIFRARSVNKMSIAVMQRMQIDIFSAMQKLSLAYFNNNQTGRLMTRINSDPMVMRQLYTDIIPNLIINIVTFIGVTVVMLLINWQLTLIVFIPIPIIIWIFHSQLPKLWRMFSRR